MIYNPTKFRVDISEEKNHKELLDFISENSFATLININSAHNDELEVSHLPLVATYEGEQLVLIGHMSRANNQWKHLENKNVTAIFNGPHTYISPLWYAENDVPTWNYLVAHLVGEAKLVSEERELIDCLKKLVELTNKKYQDTWDYFTPDDLKDGLLSKAIIGFKITVKTMHFKKKLSQNRSIRDKEGVMLGLSKRKDEGSFKVLKEMQKINT